MRAHDQAPAIRLRRAEFGDLGAVVRLIEGAIERGCASHYDPAQRRAVFLSYAQRLFVEALEPFETIVAEADGTMLGVAQIDPLAGRLRALFVAAEAQGMGLGRALLGEAERAARRHGCAALVGAMSLNAVGFYTAAGYGPEGGRSMIVHDGTRVPVVSMRKRLPSP